MNDITFSIDGKAIKAKEGATILEAASGAGIYIPALCAYPGLKQLAEEVPDRACQLCVVEVNGKFVLSCITPVSAGMVVQANTPGVQELRRKSLTAIMQIGRA